MPAPACKQYFGFKRLAAAVVSLMMVAGLPGAASAETIEGVMPLSPQPAGNALSAGIAVEYAQGFVRHVDQLRQVYGWKAGKPLVQIDYNTGNGKVLTSDRTQGVGAKLKGLIKLDRTGDYQFAIQSNDGVRMFLDGKMIIDDPGVHYDQFSPNVTVPVATPGWYAMDIIYFQRKGTATLELYWQPPGAESFEFVPAEAFAHSK